MYRTVFVPLKCSLKDFEYLKNLNALSAQVWNNCVKIDMENKVLENRRMTLSELEFKNKHLVALHAKGINHAVLKYYHARGGMWESIKNNHEGSSLAKLPYREKTYMPTGWDSQAIHPEYENNKIRLTVLKGRSQVICHVKNIPQNIVEIELVFKEKYYLAIKYKIENKNNLIQSNNEASIDLGEIHIISSIDKLGNCVIITNRRVRSLIREKDKKQGKLISLRSKCVNGSNMSTKYTKALYKLKFEYDRKILDAIHKQTRLYVNWCLEHNISKIYYGDLDTVTRDAKGRLCQTTNHKLNMWRFGQFMSILTYKLEPFGITVEKISEAYTSQTCPNCDKRNKPNGRNYKCECGYLQHRDIVGAINILNFNTNSKLTRYTKKEYLQIQ
jgi:putative transposase